MLIKIITSKVYKNTAKKMQIFFVTKIFLSRAACIKRKKNIKEFNKITNKRKIIWAARILLFF